MTPTRYPQVPRLRLRVTLLDDHPVVLNGLAVRLSSELGIDVTGLFVRAHDLLQHLERLVPDLIILDYELHPGDVDGASLIRGLRERYPGCALLVYSSHDNPDTVALIRQAGAHAFVAKHQNLTELVNAIHELAAPAWNSASAPAIAQADAAPRISAATRLSPRERDVIECYLQGLTVGQIAGKFNRSIKTVSTQKMSALRKLGVTTDYELFSLKAQLLA